MPIESRQVPALRAACIAIHTRLDRTGLDCGPVFGRLEAALDAAGMPPAGPGLIGHPEEDFDPTAFRALVAFPVTREVPAASGVEMVDFPSGGARPL
jgi:hypothetical protein